MKNQSSAIEQLDRYIRARYPAIAILPHEESRVMASIQACYRLNRKRTQRRMRSMGLLRAWKRRK